MKNTRAFPTDAAQDEGMSLRDYFAAKAMQSAIIDWGTPPTDDNFNDVANFAYKMADAMLKARGE